MTGSFWNLIPPSARFPFSMRCAMNDFTCINLGGQQLRYHNSRGNPKVSCKRKIANEGALYNSCKISRAPVGRGPLRVRSTWTSVSWPRTVHFLRFSMVHFMHEHNHAFVCIFHCKLTLLLCVGIC